VTVDYFDPIKSRLLSGVHLIEASAGTGKTYTIATLVLRFIVEHDIAIQNVLLVTFTKAATEELKLRVRSRLQEARQVLAGQKANIDASIVDWLDNLQLDPNLSKRRIDQSLLDFDQAAIFTIHGFCQRVLTEHALESGQLFAVDMLADVSTLQKACADDFWRRQIYPRSAWEASVLTASFKTPDDLLASIDYVDPNIEVFPPIQSLDGAFDQLKQAIKQARPALNLIPNLLASSFTEGKFKTSYCTSFEQNLSLLNAWLNDETAPMPVPETFSALTTHGIKNGLNGVKFKSTKDKTAAQRLDEYWTELAIDAHPCDELYSAVQQVTLTLRRNLLLALQIELNKQLQQQNKLSFESAIDHLHASLQKSAGNHLLTELQTCYTAALIDEFQDTDTKQWAIFSRLFTSSRHYLYLIGDPKQAIYNFRGADIHAYLAAQKQAQYRHTLEKNWRSQPHLVNAVNLLFQRQQAFLLDDLSFYPVQPALAPDETLSTPSTQTLPPFMLWQLPESGNEKTHWRIDRNDAAQHILNAVVQEIVSLLNGDYRLQPSGRAIQASDIAILVRSNQQARNYQEALRAAKVPAILNATESVFTTCEAVDLFHLLEAIAHPGNRHRLKQALTLSWFALDGQALYQLNTHATQMDDWAARFLAYFQEWQQKGFLAMMQRVLQQERISATLSNSETAERRLTNLRHLLELIQQAVTDEHLNSQKTLYWLSQAIAQAKQKPATQEDQQLRLESDENAVQILTLHRCKGLEFSIVFCPCHWQRHQRLKSEKHFVKCHEQHRMVADLGSEAFARRRQAALIEELAEDIRLLYVAVTRAKHRCYLAWADARAGGADNDSAMAWLLDFAGTDFAAQQSRLQSFQQQYPELFDYRLLSLSSEPSVSAIKPKTNAPVLQASQAKRSLSTHWQMSSYTALSALSQHEAPEFPEDKADEKQTPESEADNSEKTLPKGPHTGNVIHYLLENIAFHDLASNHDISALRDAACQRYGLALETPELINRLLQQTVTTPLSETDESFRLKNINPQRCLKEMPFYLSMPELETKDLNKLLHHQPAFQPLNAQALSGYLTGFIDLVCEYKGLYYVIDYKTNCLPNYRAENLLQAMQEHNYGLQYWIYSLVLHLYLQKRLSHYHYDRHFGGVRYLFVRGMQADAPMSGVYQDRPELATLEALAKLFTSHSC
jgi:exodeoxyribonuclease V beta subunit